MKFLNVTFKSFYGLKIHIEAKDLLLEDINLINLNASNIFNLPVFITIADMFHLNNLNINFC